jgi:tRNA acetyltransferase TAN1
MVERNFDLVITFNENQNGLVENELLGINEIESVLEDFNIYIKESEYFNVAMVELENNPLNAIDKLKNANTKSLTKAVPIESVVKSNTQEIEKEVIKSINLKANKGDSLLLSVTTHSRRYINSQQELINRILDKIDGEFNLAHHNAPEWVVEIEEVGPYTGVSVLKPHQIMKK